MPRTPGIGCRRPTAYDPEGPLAGVRYDAYNLTMADGKGKWWEGYDPQELYTGRNLVMPDGITTIAQANDWHNANDAKWHEEIPPMNPELAENWFCRCQGSRRHLQAGPGLLRRH